MVKDLTMDERREDLEQQHRKDLERLRVLRPMDDDFMRCLFKDNRPLAEFVLRILTDKADLVITDWETQKDMKRLAGARSVCLDEYGTDSSGKKYNLEIQRQDRGSGSCRARYLKENPEGVSEMCKILEDMRNESLEKGIREGTINTAKRMLKVGKYALEEIANISGLSLDEVKRLKAGQTI